MFLSNLRTCLTRLPIEYIKKISALENYKANKSKALLN